MARLECPVCHNKAISSSYKILLDMFDVFPCESCGSRLRVSRKRWPLMSGVGISAVLLQYFSPWSAMDAVAIGIALCLVWFYLYRIPFVALPGQGSSRT